MLHAYRSRGFLRKPEFVLRSGSQWDQELMAEGQRLLDHSAAGSELTEYHLETGIASIHPRAFTVEDTDWKSIVSLYDA